MVLCAAAQPAGQTTPRALQRHYSSRQARREGSLTSFPAGKEGGASSEDGGRDRAAGGRTAAGAGARAGPHASAGAVGRPQVRARDAGCGAASGASGMVRCCRHVALLGGVFKCVGAALVTENTFL